MALISSPNIGYTHQIGGGKPEQNKVQKKRKGIYINCEEAWDWKIGRYYEVTHLSLKNLSNEHGRKRPNNRKESAISAPQETIPLSIDGSLLSTSVPLCEDFTENECDQFSMWMIINLFRLPLRIMLLVSCFQFQSFCFQTVALKLHNWWIICFAAVFSFLTDNTVLCLMSTM